VSGGFAHNTSNNTALDITCPIVKTTSNWGITSGDQITAVSITVSGGASTTVNCTVKVWDVSPATGGGLPSQQKADQSTPFSNYSNPSHVTQSLSVTNVSTAAGYFSRSAYHPEWFYAEMMCTLSAGTTLETYHVTEAGTAQSDAAIYPSSICRPLTSSPANTPAITLDRVATLSVSTNR
jgi:hypothetical protein